MNIHYQKKFLKDLAWIPSPLRKKIEDFAFKELPTLVNFSHVKGAEHITGYPIITKFVSAIIAWAFIINDGLLTIERILHRREIYRYFP